MPVISLDGLQYNLVAWAAGLAFASGGISLARIVGPGFIWMTSGTAGILSLAGWFAGDQLLVGLGGGMLLISVIWARNRPFAGALQILAAGLYLAAATGAIGLGLATAATLALGGVSAEMLLGHWYLLDPRLPRAPLRLLAGVGIAGLALDALLLGVNRVPPGGGVIVFWVLSATSIVLMVAVVAALRYPAYAGVMAATGLSYLAVLTSLGTVFLGLALVAGVGPLGVGTGVAWS